jgi:hypothetical protein
MADTRLHVAYDRSGSRAAYRRHGGLNLFCPEPPGLLQDFSSTDRRRVPESILDPDKFLRLP